MIIILFFIIQLWPREIDTHSGAEGRRENVCTFSQKEQGDL